MTISFTAQPDFPALDERGRFLQERGDIIVT
jgi:hypothetical protein